MGADKHARRRVPLVRDYMTRSVVAIDSGASGLELQQLLLDHRILGCPVIDERGGLAGVVSRSDLVRQLAVARARAEEISNYYRDLQTPPEVALDEIAELGDALMRGVRVEDIMSRRLIAVVPDDVLQVAAQRMLEHHVHRVLVLDKGRLEGVLTSQDMVRAVAAGPAA
jgi:CBS domain-containing protein